jgi:hypothetical protein
MNKYVSPTIEYVEVDTADVVMASGYQIKALEGVDTGDEKTAVFDISRWI